MKSFFVVLSRAYLGKDAIALGAVAKPIALWAVPQAIAHHLNVLSLHLIFLLFHLVRYQQQVLELPASPPQHPTLMP